MELHTDSIQSKAVLLASFSDVVPVPVQVPLLRQLHLGPGRWTAPRVCGKKSVLLEHPVIIPECGRNKHRPATAVLFELSLGLRSPVPALMA